MNDGVRRSRPSWRAGEARFLRPELWLVATVVVAMMLLDVWQSSHVAELCLHLDRSRVELKQADGRLQTDRAELERRGTRSELAPVAAQLGLVPADASQIVNLPSEYLAGDEGHARGRERASLVSWAENLSHALVPEATARGRARD